MALFESLEQCFQSYRQELLWNDKLIHVQAFGKVFQEALLDVEVSPKY